jgi:hypothetical protein
MQGFALKDATRGDVPARLAGQRLMTLVIAEQGRAADENLAETLRSASTLTVTRIEKSASR